MVGANGSGKSTLARLLGGLERPAGASLAIACGCDLLSEEGRMAARREVGVLFQNPENQLVAECVEDDVAFGLENLGWAAEAIRARVDEMLERFWLTELEGGSRTCSPAGRSSGRRWPACWPCRGASSCSTSPPPCWIRRAVSRCWTRCTA